MVPSLDLIITAVGCGVLLPAVVTAAALVFCLRSTRPKGGAEQLAVAAGLAAGFGALAATGQTDWNCLRPVNCWDWLPGLALLACAVDFLDRLIFDLSTGAARRFPALTAPTRWAAPLGVGALTGWVLVRSQSTIEHVPMIWAVALALVVLILWSLSALARRWPGAGLAVLLAMIAFATAAVVELAGFMKLAQMAGVLGGALAGCAIIGWWRPRLAVAEAAIPALAVLLPGLLFATSFNTFSEVPETSYLLVIAAPALLALTGIAPLARLSAGALVLMRTGAALLPLAAAMALALTA
jgi:hypothetical protein